VVFELDEEGWLLLERPRPTTTSEMDVGWSSGNKYNGLVITLGCGNKKMTGIICCNCKGQRTLLPLTYLEKQTTSLRTQEAVRKQCT
jgi:hypothetical protein